MPDTINFIPGRVTANGTHNGASGLRVELRAGDGSVVARALTDTRGGFTLEVAAAAL